MHEMQTSSNRKWHRLPVGIETPTLRWPIAAAPLTGCSESGVYRTYARPLDFMHKSSFASPFTTKGCLWHRCTHLPHYLFTLEDALGNPVLSIDHPTLPRAVVRVVRVHHVLSDSWRHCCSSPRSFQEAPCRPSTRGYVFMSTLCVLMSPRSRPSRGSEDMSTIYPMCSCLPSVCSCRVALVMEQPPGVVAVRLVLARLGANVGAQTVPEVTVCLSL